MATNRFETNRFETKRFIGSLTNWFKKQWLFHYISRPSIVINKTNVCTYTTFFHSFLFFFLNFCLFSSNLWGQKVVILAGLTESHILSKKVFKTRIRRRARSSIFTKNWILRSKNSENSFPNVTRLYYKLLCNKYNVILYLKTHWYSRIW